MDTEGRPLVRGEGKLGRVVPAAAEHRAQRTAQVESTTEWTSVDTWDFTTRQLVSTAPHRQTDNRSRPRAPQTLPSRGNGSTSSRAGPRRGGGWAGLSTVLEAPASLPRLVLWLQ